MSELMVDNNGNSAMSDLHLYSRRADVALTSACFSGP